MQIRNGLSSTASLQLLHDQVRLHAQEQRLTGISITCRSPSLQCFCLEQGLFTELLVAHFEATLRPGLKSSEGRGLDRRGRHAEGNQDCDGARDQGSWGRFAEMMPQYRSITPPCTPTGPPLPCCCSPRCLC